MRRKICTIAILMLLSFSLYNLKAQESNDNVGGLRKDAVKVFIDCHHCDMDYIREQIPYLNYVRDVREAELYILEPSQSTGS